MVCLKKYLVRRQRIEIVLININHESLWEEPRGGPCFLKDFSEVFLHLDRSELLEFRVFAVMKEIAPFSIGAASVFEEPYTFFGLISVVGLVIAPELMPAVCKFAFILVGAIAILDKLFAKL